MTPSVYLVNNMNHIRHIEPQRNLTRDLNIFNEPNNMIFLQFNESSTITNNNDVSNTTIPINDNPPEYNLVVSSQNDIPKPPEYSQAYSFRNQNSL